MKKVYLIFDQLPSALSGGLVTTYERLISLLKNDYKFEIISVISCGKEYDERFDNTEIHNISKHNFFPRVTRIGTDIHEKNLFPLLNTFFNLILFLMYIPIARYKIKKIISKGSTIIAVSPSSAMFIPNTLKFILEIHTKFDYFWNGNIISKMQLKLMQNPSITLFRTKADSKKASELMNSNYMYNFFDNSNLGEIKIDHIKRNKKIIFIGRLMPQKNLLKMLECAKELKKYHPDFILDIYGEGPMKALLIEKIEKYNLQNNVTLKGFCNDKNIYSNYSIQWLTSDVEGFPLVIIEAKANGVPTITTSWGSGVNEVITSGYDGYIQDTVNGIVDKTNELWSNKELLLKLSYNSLESYENFSAKASYDKWKSVIDEYRN